MEPIISVRGLGKRYRIRAATSKRYQTLRDDLADTVRGFLKGKFGEPKQDFWALRDVSFDIDPGEVIGIIGRNGAGKSTLLKILARVTQPTTGEAVLWGRVASLLEVGTGFHPELTGRENIFMSGAVLGMKHQEIQKNFDEIVAFAEVEKFLETPVKRYSSGMYVRLAFAVAAHLETEILLVDEVLAVGDAAFQKKCLGKLGDVALQQGRTVLFVSHSMAAINALCHEVIWVHAGQLQERGQPAEVISHYLTHQSDTAAEVHLQNTVNTTAPALISKVTIENEAGDLTNQFQMGEEVIIRFEISAQATVRQVALSVDLKTITGIKICHLVDRDFGFTLDELKTRNCIRVSIPNLSFYPGSYLLSVWVGDPMGHTYDYAEDCIKLEVSPGKLINRSGLSWEQALMTCPSIWQEEV